MVLRWLMPKASTRSLSATPKPVDEKITINLGCVDLGQIDLLVQEGFYANRTDLIRTAIRNQLATHGEAVRQVVARKTLSLGIQHFSKSDLQAAEAAGEKLNIRVLGLATIDPAVTPELALATIESLTVLGALHASAAVKAALSKRIR
ncbi:MAG: putative transcriptional regulator, CopG/Arc/MetJ DNA-binding domain [Ramlibacter sp.]|nr:putative transcriptional regulator, CopG/Arc/MetJ DNA-binding domain [Ramlibacter sp.]